jgi:hypothetical protein
VLWDFSGRVAVGVIVGALTGVEWETLHDPEGLLVNFLVGEVNRRPCARLNHYLFMTKRFLTFCKDTDGDAKPLLTNPKAKPLAEDDNYLARQIANQIKVQGLNLKEMLEHLKMEPMTDDICLIYAHLVLAYRNVENCKKIVQEFISAGFSVREGTCG